MSGEEPTQDGLRRAVLIVALLNLAYFGIEFAVALAIGSVSLFADSIDFLEDGEQAAQFSMIVENQFSDVQRSDVRGSATAYLAALPMGGPHLGGSPDLFALPARARTSIVMVPVTAHTVGGVIAPRKRQRRRPFP